MSGPYNYWKGALAVVTLGQQASTTAVLSRPGYILALKDGGIRSISSAAIPQASLKSKLLISESCTVLALG